MTDGLELIARQRADIERRRLEAKKLLADLDAEEAELRIAERVLSKLSTAAVLHAIDNDAAPPDLPIPKNGSRRPSGIPTTRKMIDTILADAKGVGVEGLNGRDLVLEIRKRWWPGVGWNDVLPEAARLVRIGDLNRNGKLYVRVPERMAVRTFTFTNSDTE